MLPTYKNVQEPLYNNLYEVILISENFHIDNAFDIKYYNTSTEDLIFIKSIICIKDIINFNFSDFLKDIKYITHVIYDKTGIIQAQF